MHIIDFSSVCFPLPENLIWRWKVLTVCEWWMQFFYNFLSLFLHYVVNDCLIISSQNNSMNFNDRLAASFRCCEILIAARIKLHWRVHSLISNRERSCMISIFSLLPGIILNFSRTISTQTVSLFLAALATVKVSGAGNMHSSHFFIIDSVRTCSNDNKLICYQTMMLINVSRYNFILMKRF